MDGVPGLSFHGIRPGETYVYRFQVRQGGTYWYHSHSGFQEQRGLYGPLVIDPIAPEPFRFDREHVVMLTDWTDERPARVFAKLKKRSDYYNLHQRTVGDFFARRAQAGPEADAGRSQDVGRHADEPDRPRRRLRRDLHLPDERRDAAGQLDRPVQARRARPAAVHQRLGDVVLRRPDSRADDDGRRGRRPVRASGHRRRVPHRHRRNLRRHRRAVGPGCVHDLRAVEGSHRVRGRHAGRAAGAARAGAGARPRVRS